MKCVLVTDGSRMRSAIVKTSGVFTSPCTSNRCVAGSMRATLA